MIRSVAVPVLDGVAPFELGVICEVFGISREGLPEYDFAVCSPGGRPVRARGGFTIVPSHDLSPLDEADLVAVPAMPDDDVPDELLEALRHTVDRGGRVMSVCTGAFLLGQAGLLDDRQCTVHWMHADALARRFPRAKVDPNVLYVMDGPVLTSAGTAAGIDAALYLVRCEHGSKVANALARRMVVPPHRDGGQAQYIEVPLPKDTAAPTLEPLLSWMVTHLDQQIGVEDLAQRVHMAPRTFARRFRAETGATPHDWLVGQRLLLARQLLEETDLTVDAIALRAGFGTAAQLRHHFAKRLDTTPQAYRATFRRRSA